LIGGNDLELLERNSTADRSSRGNAAGHPHEGDRISSDYADAGPTTSSFIEEGSMLGMELEQQTRLRKGIFKGNTTKEWNKKQYEA
jgi:hypothetical protein